MNARMSSSSHRLHSKYLGLTIVGVALVNPYLADSVAYSVPDDFTYKFEGINVQYSYQTRTPIESSGRDASIAYRFCMHQSAS